MPSLLTDIADGLGGVVDELRTRADQIEQHFKPVIHDGAALLERLSQSTIVSELMQLADGVLPATTEQAIVAIIRDAGAAAARVAELTAPPAPPADQPPPAPPVQ